MPQSMPLIFESSFQGDDCDSSSDSSTFPVTAIQVDRGSSTSTRSCVLDEDLGSSLEDIEDLPYDDYSITLPAQDIPVLESSPYVSDTRNLFEISAAHIAEVPSPEAK